MVVEIFYRGMTSLSRGLIEIFLREGSHRGRGYPTRRPGCNEIGTEHLYECLRQCLRRRYVSYVRKKIQASTYIV